MLQPNSYIFGPNFYISAQVIQYSENGSVEGK